MVSTVIDWRYNLTGLPSSSEFTFTGVESSYWLKYAWYYNAVDCMSKCLRRSAASFSVGDHRAYKYRQIHCADIVFKLFEQWFCHMMSQLEISEFCLNRVTMSRDVVLMDWFSIKISNAFTFWQKKLTKKPKKIGEWEQLYWEFSRINIHLHIMVFNKMMEL